MFEKYATTVIVILLAIIVWLIFALVEYRKACKLWQDLADIQKQELEMLRKHKIVGKFNDTIVTMGYALTDNAAKFVNNSIEKFQRNNNERKDTHS